MSRGLLSLWLLMILAPACHRGLVDLEPRPDPAPEQAPPKRQAPPLPGPEASADPSAQTPRLLPGTDGEPCQGKTIHETLARAEQLLEFLRERALSEEQLGESNAGATFITQAREALAANDPDRAAVLAEKSIALIENLELATRP